MESQSCLQLQSMPVRSEEMVSDQVNGDFIEELCKEIDTEEFEQIQEKAVAAVDEQPIIDWLKEKGMYLNYERINEYLHSILSVIHKRTSKKH